MVLTMEEISSGNERVIFQGDQIDIRMHDLSDLLDVQSLMDILQDLFIRQGIVGGKNIGFVFHTVSVGFKEFKFLKTSQGDRLFPVKKIMPQLVEQNDLLHIFWKIVLQEDEAVFQNDFIGTFLIPKRSEQDRDAHGICQSIRITGAVFFVELIGSLDNIDEFDVQE